MISNFKTTNPRTVKAALGYNAENNKATTARSSLSTTRKRGNTQTMFAGGMAYLSNDAAQTFNVQLSITNGTTEYYLARVEILPGDSAVWLEEEYGVILDEDQYAKITTIPNKSQVSGDTVSVFLHTKEVV